MNVLVTEYVVGFRSVCSVPNFLIVCVQIHSPVLFFRVVGLKKSLVKMRSYLKVLGETIKQSGGGW